MNNHASDNLITESEILLFASSIIQNTFNNIHKNDYQYIICDRFILSFIVYSKYSIIKNKLSDELNNIIITTSNIINNYLEDRVIIEFFLDTPLNIIRERIKNGRDKIEENLDLLLLRDIYIKSLNEQSNSNIIKYRII